MKFARILSVLVLAFVFACEAGAVSSSIWTLRGAQEFASGETKNLSMSSKGQMRLDSEFKKIASEDAESLALWSSAIDGKGAVYFGTGTGAAIYRLKDEKLERVPLDEKYTTDLIVTCMAADAQDNIYAALLPSGRIVKITPDGKVSEYAMLPEMYIWDICIDPRGAMYVGTGPAGRLYRITEDGKKTEKIYDSDEDHIFSLALGDDGALYFGTSQGAVLFSISPEELGKEKPRPSVVRDFPGTDIRDIYAREGEIFVVVNNAANAESYDYLGEMPGGEEPAMEYPTRGYTAGTVFRIDKNGDLSALINSSNLISCIRGAGDNIFIATIGENRVYRYDMKEDEIFSFQIDEPQALTLETFNGHLAAIGASGPGVVYRVGDRPAEEGMYTSRVYDAGNSSEWGTIKCRASGKLAIQTRTGQTEKPDSTWSEWSQAEVADAVQVKSPKGRFIQFRIVWGDRQAVLEEISLSYVAGNMRPVITVITVGAAEGGNNYLDMESEMPRMPATLPRGTVLGGQNLQVTWEANDPNGDPLEFNVSYKENSEKRWKLLNQSGPIRANSLTTQPGLFPSGKYRIKVVASDRPGNPDGNVLEQERISDEFVIDNTAPTVTGLKAATVRNMTRISGLATEETTRVARVEYALDGAEWKAGSTADRIFDDKKEELAVMLENLEPGEHTIVVRVCDENGNIGAAHLVFEVPKP